MQALTPINEARDAHPGFSRQAVPESVALRAVARVQQRLLARLADIKPDLVHTEVTITLPLATFSEGGWIAGPNEDDDVVAIEYLHLHGRPAAVPTDTTRRHEPIELVRYERRNETFDGPAAYLRGDRLFLCGVAADWTGYGSIIVDLFPQGPEELTLQTSLVLPGRPKAALTAMLAAIFARRVEGSPIGALHMAADYEEEAYYDAATGRRRARVGRAAEVW